MKKFVWLGVLAVLVAIGYSQCVPRKLDEFVFYQGPEFKLKLVRYFENIPLHYTGEVYRVMCSSANTADRPAKAKQDRGWVTIGNGGAIGSTSAKELADQVRPTYRVMDESTLVYGITWVIQVSFDACGSFRYWDPTTLPDELIDSAEKDDSCKPKGIRDCRYEDFIFDRRPQIDQLQADRTGHISFRVRSKGFKDNAVLRVESKDFGKTWRAQPISRQVDGQGIGSDASTNQ